MFALAPATEDWSAIHARIDRHVSEWTPETLAAAYVERGCAVVRGAIDVARIEALRSVVDRTPWEGHHLYDQDIQAATAGAMSGYDILPPIAYSVLDRVAAPAYRRANATFRRQRGGVEKGQPAIPIHIDSQLHKLTLLTVNFWCPFDAAGRDAPGLKLVPVSIAETVRHVGYTGAAVSDDPDRNQRFFEAERFTDAAVTAAFGADCWLAPELAPGDFILSSNWIIHATHTTPAMTRRRLNVELRFFSTRHVVPLPQADA